MGTKSPPPSASQGVSASCTKARTDASSNARWRKARLDERTLAGVRRLAGSRDDVVCAEIGKREGPDASVRTANQYARQVG